LAGHGDRKEETGCMYADNILSNTIKVRGGTSH